MSSVPYQLQTDPLNASGGFHARVLPRAVLTLEDVVDRLAQQGTTFSRAELLAAAQHLMNGVAEIVAEGCFVNLPICNLRPAVRGRFTSREEAFGEGGQVMTATASAGPALKKRLSRARAERVEGMGGGVDRPRVNHFLRGVEKRGHGPLLPGDFGLILGARLKFDPAGADEGVFFKPVTPEGAALPDPPVQLRAMVQHTDGRLLFQVPALPPGSYQCSVRRRFGRHRTHLRTGLLQELLVVEPA